jgi:hypothetical protein
MAAEAVVTQVKQVIEPIKERNPDVFDHLAQAGSELLAAYRAAVSGHERRWTAGPDSAAGSSSSEHIDLD